MELITTHIGADFDSLASMVAASKLYPEAVLSFPGSMEHNVRDFLALYKHVVEIKKPKDVPVEKITRLILVDTRLASRIGDFAQIRGVPVHIYDHHPDTGEDLAGEVCVNRLVGATSTILTKIIEKRKIPLTQMEATILMLGIYEDTGSLTYGSTTPQDLEACAYLLAGGANLNLIADFVNPGLTPAQLGLLNKLLLDMRMINFNGVKIAIASAEMEEYTGSLSLVVHKLRDMENISVIFVIAAMRLVIIRVVTILKTCFLVFMLLTIKKNIRK